MPGSERPPAGWPGWPDGKQFAVVLTHDVESPTGVKNIPRLMEADADLGFRSSFNLIPEGSYRVNAELRETIQSAGFELGVHDLHHDGKLFLTRNEFNRRAVRINRYLKDWGAAGFRSGFMLHNLAWLHALDIQYDASTFDTDPFEPQPVGRHTIFPFWVPRPGHAQHSTLNAQPSDGLAAPQRSEGGYVELPYTLPQDSTLFLLLQERQPDIWFQKLDWIAKHGGMALVNVHPDYLRFDKDPASHTFPAEFYIGLLKYIRQKYNGQFWQPLPRDLAAYCRSCASPLDKNATRSTCSPGFSRPSLCAKHAAVVLYSGYPSDPRPRRELQALLDQGMSIDLICLRDGPADPPGEVTGHLRITRLPIQHKRSGKLRYFWQYARFFLHSFLLLSARSFRRRYDLVHVHNMPDFLIFAAILPKLRGARLILDLHDPMPEVYQTIYKLREDSTMVRWLKRLEKWSISCADLVLTPNEAFRRLFCARSCPESKIRIVMNTPDEKIFRPEDPANRSGSGKEFRVMYHGLIAQRHGLDTAIEALSKLTHVDASVVLDIFGGRNAYLEEILLKAKSRGLNGRVRYKGKRRIDDIPSAILEADLGVIPNCRTPFTEINFPTRIFEYLCLSKPVIVPRTKGIRDYFDEDQILFFEAENPEDLARVIAWVQKHPVQTGQIVARGKEVYARHRWCTERQTLLASVELLLSKS